jgi:Mce-associated membrane protein
LVLAGGPDRVPLATCSPAVGAILPAMLIGSNDLPDTAPDRGSTGRRSEVLIGSSRPVSEARRSSAEDSGPSADAAETGGSTQRAGEEANRRGWLGRWGLLCGAAVVIVVLAIGLILALLHIGHQDDLNSARSQALAAARTDSVEVGSYDYQHLNQDFGLVEQHSTSSFRATWAQSSQALVSVLTKYHATSVAHVLAAGVESASTDRVVAVVFINQTVTNDSQKTPTTDQSRLEITLVRQHGQWLIDKLTLL